MIRVPAGNGDRQCLRASDARTGPSNNGNLTREIRRHIETTSSVINVIEAPRRT